MGIQDFSIVTDRDPLGINQIFENKSQTDPP